MAQDGMEDQNLRLNEEQEDSKNWVLEPVNDEQQYGLDLLWIPVLDAYFSKEFPDSLDSITMDLKNVN